MPRLPLRTDWADLADDELLNVRMADLPLAIDGTLAERLDQLRGELAARGLAFALHFYLSDEWFTPDGATTIAIPFYMAHPRLARLEESQMLEVEGGEHEWCMRIRTGARFESSTVKTSIPAAAHSHHRSPVTRSAR